jgi:hypothetical protein
MKRIQITKAPSLKLPLTLALAATVLTSGCTVLTYRGQAGETFSRVALGSTTAISSLTFESDTNGLKRVELQGYSNDSNQALGTVTEAAVRAALQPK